MLHENLPQFPDLLRSSGWNGRVPAGRRDGILNGVGTSIHSGSTEGQLTDRAAAIGGSDQLSNNLDLLLDRLVPFFQVKPAPRLVPGVSPFLRAATGQGFGSSHRAFSLS
jgi:hypothetical protein